MRIDIFIIVDSNKYLGLIKAVQYEKSNLFTTYSENVPSWHKGGNSIILDIPYFGGITLFCPNIQNKGV